MTKVCWLRQLGLLDARVFGLAADALIGSPLLVELFLVVAAPVKVGKIEYEVLLMKEIIQAIVQTLRGGQSVALVTVIRSMGSTPRHAAAKMVVKPDGSFVGTIGGGSMEHTAIRDALAALSTGEPCLVK